MKSFTVVVMHLATLVLVVFGILRSGERPPVLVYAWVLDYALRLITLRLMLQALSAGNAGLGALVSAVSTPPDPGERSSPLTDEATGRPVAFPGYLIVVSFLATIAFVLANVNAQKQVDLDAATLVHDLRWAGWLAMMYWAQGLASRTIVIDPGAPRELNLGYNAGDLRLLAVAVLAAGAAAAVRQTAGMASSGWVVLGPLLGVRFLFDLTSALRASALRLRATRPCNSARD